MLALVIWILSVMIIPRTAVLLAGRAVDVPSFDEIYSQRSRYAASLWQEDRRAMSNYQVPPGAPMQQAIRGFQAFMADLNESRDKKTREFARRLEEDRQNKQSVQEQVAFGLARVSPSATFSLAAMTLSGTGIHLKDEFTRSAQRYQQAFSEFLKEKTGVTPSGGLIFRVSTDSTTKAKPQVQLAEIPVFTFDQPMLSAILGNAAIDFSILVLFNLVFFVGAFVAFLRYDVR